MISATAVVVLVCSEDKVTVAVVVGYGVVFALFL